MTPHFMYCFSAGYFFTNPNFSLIGVLGLATEPAIAFMEILCAIL